MNLFANTKGLKSIYIDLFVFIFSLNTPQTVTGLSFQGFYEEAHVIIPICPVRKLFSAKALISLCLGRFGLIGGQICEGNKTHA